MSSLPPEAQALQAIDQQLAAAGWAVQDVKEINLAAHLEDGTPEASVEYPLSTLIAARLICRRSPNYFQVAHAL